MSTPVSGDSVSRRPMRRKSAKNYDESLADELIEKHIGSTSKKRNRTKEEMEKETETEAMIALSLGFPIDELLVEEIKAGVVSELGGKEQNDYIVIRNHILAKWRENVRAWLSKGQLTETVSGEYESLMNSAYDFLLYNGYINFGVSPSFCSQNTEEEGIGSVIIIGAGLAGLAAAKQLMSFGFKVIVLEGRRRPGGRVYTEKMGTEGKNAAVDLGGSVITGIHANPLGVLARQLSIPLHKVRDGCLLYKPDGSAVEKEVDLSVELIFNKLLDKVNELRRIMGSLANQISLGTVLETLRQLYAVAKSNDEKQLLDWHFANLEYANAGCLMKLSAAYWDQDDPYEMGGDHCFLAGGNGRLIGALCKEVPIFYCKTVHTVKYGNDGVEVIAGDQVFHAEMVLCTVPLGILKKQTIKFEPELPKRKLTSIERLGFGLLNKVAMLFPHVFWGEDRDTFGCLSEHSEKRGEYFLFYGYHTVSGGPVLVALVAGEAAYSFEVTNPTSILHRVLSILRGIYGPKGIDVPNPLQSMFTRWGSDPFSYGSYSHVKVQSSGSDYDVLSESVDDRLFFAGEATNRKYPATMHGAYLSGLREAGNILRATQVRRSHPRKCIQKTTGPTIDLLCELFKDPDLTLGRLLFVFNPLSDDLNSTGLMRVTFGKSVGKRIDDMVDEQLQLYTILTREQALQLQIITGGTGSKLAYLCTKLQLKLMGVNGLGAEGNTVAANIYTARRGRDRNQLL